MLAAIVAFARPELRVGLALEDVAGLNERLAQAELRSVNAQIEYLLRDALLKRGITPKGTPKPRK